MKTLADLWRMHARRSPDATAVVFDGERRSFAGLVERAGRLASALHAVGVRPGDRVAMMAMNRAEWFDYYTAAELFGFIAAPINFRLAGPEVAYIVADAQPKAVIFESQYAHLFGALREHLSSEISYICLDAAKPDWAMSYDQAVAKADPSGPDHAPRPDDIVRLMYTSGTTGRPKGVARSQYADLVTVQCAYTNIEYRPLGSGLYSMPMFHIGAQALTLAMHWGGGTVHLHRSFDPLETLRTIERERIETTLLVPTMLMQVLDIPDLPGFDVSSLRSICYSAAPMPETVLRKALGVFGPIFVNVYTQTETGQGTVLYAREHQIDTDPKAAARLPSVGRQSQFTELRIVDDNGQECPVGVPGEILIKSDAAMSYYWNKPEATAETKRDGWIYTGDIGKLDEERYLYLVDRKKDVIISGGENIYCREVEEALMAHPAVRDVAVIGVPDEKWGEAVMGVVVPASGQTVTVADLIAHCSALIARYKLPKSVVFVEDLPRLPSGKVHKPTLRDLYCGK